MMEDPDERPDRWRLGDRIDNRYEIIKIRHGGMGVLYICFDAQTKEPVGIKTLKEDFVKSCSAVMRSELIEQFKQQVEAWVSLGYHPNVVQALSLKEIEGKPYVLVEYVAGNGEYGVDLLGWIRWGGLQVRGQPDIPLILNFSIQFCHGMIYAESKFKEMGRPFVHRDIKPSNILITRDGVVKIADFFLAKTMTGQFEGKVSGTPAYMSPEQWSGSSIDIPSDIYSFGCVLYQMVTGKPPFTAVNFVDYKKCHLNVIPESLDVDEDLKKIILKCLEKDPGNRYKDFVEVKMLLSSVYYKLTGEAVPLLCHKSTGKEAPLSNRHKTITLHQNLDSGDTLEAITGDFTDSLKE